MSRLGGRILADQLRIHGAQLAFCVPGESYLALLDGLYDHRDAIRVVTCRHEAAATNAAEAYGKLTGRPGISMVTRGPGATHAAVGVHTAMQDSSPLLLLVGQVATASRRREAFQEVDHETVFGSIAKWACEVDRPERIPELVARAYATATSDRPGPVVLSLPEDVLAACAEVADAAPYEPVEPVPAEADMEELHRLLARAERPLALVGGGPWDRESADRLTAWLTASGVPVAASWRRQDIVDNRTPCYVGHVGLAIDPRLADRVRDADLLLAVGTRMTDIETQGYTLPAAPGAAPSLVHVHPDSRELGRVYQPRLSVLAAMRPFTSALARLAPVDGSRRREWATAARADYEDHRRVRPTAGAGVDLGEAMAHLRAALPSDAILANGAGNNTVWAHRFFEYRGLGTQLAPQSGAMGYGVPAALAAKLVHPERVVVALSGDGDFQMCGQELATMAQEGLAVVVIVVNNGMLATIRMHQERHFPQRVIGTELANPDFTALARAYGAHAQRVERTGDVPGAVEAALAAGRPAVIELVADREAISRAESLDELRAQGEAARIG